MASPSMATPLPAARLRASGANYLSQAFHPTHGQSVALPGDVLSEALPRCSAVPTLETPQAPATPATDPP